MSSEPTVIHNAAAGRFEAHTAHGTAVLTYANRDGALDLTHTKVPESAEGAGIGSALAREALEYVRRERLRVIPTCPFVSSYIGKHPEYADLVAPS